MNLVNIEARDLPDAWFQCVYKVLEEGQVFKIDKGSYAGQKRLEFDYITINVKYPVVRPLLPQIPSHYGIPNPVDNDYLEEYLPYLMTANKKEDESYTYGQRLTAWGDHTGRVTNQIQEIIEMYKTGGHRTNQACATIAVPPDIHLADPPCLRHIDTRIQEKKLHFFIYFRSWDLWSGFPANLGALQLLKEYMALEIGVEDGEMIASSKGLHLYDHCFDLAKILRMKEDMTLKNGE